MLAVPLVAPESVIGLLAVFPPAARVFDENEVALMTALAAQLAVAVENARLHEEAKELGAQLEHALAAEREFARRLRAQYEISHSFTHSLSLEATLEAVTRTMVETLGIDAAAMRLPDGRGECSRRAPCTSPTRSSRRSARSSAATSPRRRHRSAGCSARASRSSSTAARRRS